MCVDARTPETEVRMGIFGAGQVRLLESDTSRLRRRIYCLC